MAAPVIKDEELELRIDSLAYGGNGVARLNGFVVFVKRGLPGDLVRARVTKVKRSHAEAEAVEVLEPGAPRVDAPCIHFPACGGCRYQDLAYEAQLEAKAGQVSDALARIGGLRDLELEPAVPAESIFHYRNKLEYSFTRHAGRRRARAPPGRTLGRGARPGALLAHDRSRERDPRGRPHLGARGGACAVRPGGPARLPAPPRRPRGPQHGAGARHARDRARRARGRGPVRRRAAALPRGALDPLGGERPPRRGDEPARRSSSGATSGSRRRSSASASACGRTRSSRRTPRCASGSTAWRPSTPG